MNGHAWMDTGHILAPTGTTRRQLYILADECGHIALHSAPRTRSKPRHVKEHEAESYAHRALTAHGLEVPEESTYGALRIGSKRTAPGVSRSVQWPRRSVLVADHPMLP
jgi:hypothetical protein